MSKAYEIVKKNQNEVVQSNMSNMQTAGKKNRSTTDNIIVINAVIEKPCSLQGGPEKFSMLAKRGDLHFLIFFGGGKGVSKKGGVIFSGGGG